MGEEGTAFVHKVMEFTLNYQYSVTERFIAKCPALIKNPFQLLFQFPDIFINPSLLFLHLQYLRCNPLDTFTDIQFLKNLIFLLLR